MGLGLNGYFTPNFPEWKLVEISLQFKPHESFPPFFFTFIRTKNSLPECARTKLLKNPNPLRFDVLGSPKDGIMVMGQCGGQFLCLRVIEDKGCLKCKSDHADIIQRTPAFLPQYCRGGEEEGPKLLDELVSMLRWVLLHLQPQLFY